MADGPSPRSRRGVLQSGGLLLAASLAGCSLLGAGPTDRETVTPVGAEGDGGAGAGSAAADEPSTTSTPGATGPTPVEKLAPPERREGARFGTAVDLDGAVAVVGASRDRVDNDPIGGAFVFRREADTWAHEATLRAPNPARWSGFGEAVAVAGDTVLVGAPQENSPKSVQAGAVYVFRHTGDGWAAPERLLPSDGQGEEFGTNLALRGETALVGASPISRIDAPLTGSAYVFERGADGWRLVTELEVPDSDDRDVFGSSLSLGAETALVGASRAMQRDGDRTGRVYAFERAGRDWPLQDSLEVAGAGHGAAVGESVAHREGTAVVGAAGFRHPDGDRAGALAVFEREGASWTARETLLPVAGEAGDRFAHAVAVAEGGILAGAPRADTDRGADAGALYVFGETGGSWSYETTVAADRTGPDYRFGHALAVDGPRVLAGMPGDVDADGTRVGSVFVLRR